MDRHHHSCADQRTRFYRYFTLFNLVCKLPRKL
jgi:hypothetical protein